MVLLQNKKGNHFYIIDREQFLFFSRFQGEGSARIGDVRGHFHSTRLSLDGLRKKRDCSQSYSIIYLQFDQRVKFMEPYLLNFFFFLPSK